MVLTARRQQQKILLLEGVHPLAIECLESSGFIVEREARAFSEDELIERAKGFDALGIRSKTKITEKVINELPQLTAIGCFCIGTNQVALTAANKHGVPVFNAPYSNTRSVAELVIGEMVALSRQLGDRNMKAHQGIWQKSAAGAREVRGKTLGVVGYGHIGSQLSILAESMGLNVIYFDIIKKLPIGNANPVDTLEALLAQSDFVSLHVPETTLTKNMIGTKQLEQMKKGAYLINASRGSVVDIPALAAALETEHLGGAAVDVYPSEPKSNKEKFASELQGLPNVILTPHIGGSTEEAQENIGREVAESFGKFFQQGSTTGAVNFPTVEVPALDEVPRVVNVHRNVPGVLSEVNSIVSAAGGNVRAQHLSTDSKIGYLVMDLGRCDAVEVAENIGALKTSIRTRIIFPPSI